MAVEVKLGGYTERYHDETRARTEPLVPAKVPFLGVPYDTQPILALSEQYANTLRLWRARGSESFDFEVSTVATTTGQSTKRWPRKT